VSLVFDSESAASTASTKRLATPSYWQTRRWILAGTGAVYAIAFGSLWVQIDGLVGSGGILPAQEFLDVIGPRLGATRWWRLPTLTWATGASDLMLHVLCGAGFVSGLALALGFVPFLSSMTAWLLYLSLVVIGRDFLGFQWDSLLLEMGFLAWVGAPLFARHWGSVAWRTEPPWVWVLLLRLLLFKLMWLSGAVKWSSGDPSWRDLSALTYHYETTCLPTWTGWYMHQLPSWLHKVSVLGVFVAELVVPFLVFGRRRARSIAFGCIAGLMALIAATGNYGFFNLQTMVLCLALLDDQPIDRLLRRPPSGIARLPTARWRLVSTGCLGILLLFLNAVVFARALRQPVEWPRPVATLAEYLAPFHVANGYGLFARMTTTRPEIILEGSEDGVVWHAYEFRWKPGSQDRRPGFVQPHMPRLDWQMWFAALGTPQGNRWFLPLCYRLLVGSPDVVRLVGENPFRLRPPRFIRSSLYEFRFTRIADRSREWWHRERLRRYTPVLTLDESGRGLRTAPEVDSAPDP